MLKVQFLSKNYILTTQNVLPKNTHIALEIFVQINFGQNMDFWNSVLG